MAEELTGRSLGELEKDLAAATAALREARRVEDDARRTVTSCLNTLTSIQKAIDTRLQVLRKNSPHGVAWAEQPRGCDVV